MTEKHAEPSAQVDAVPEPAHAHHHPKHRREDATGDVDIPLEEFGENPDRELAG